VTVYQLVANSQSYLMTNKRHHTVKIVSSCTSARAIS